MSDWRIASERVDAHRDLATEIGYENVLPAHFVSLGDESDHDSWVVPWHCVQSVPTRHLVDSVLTTLLGFDFWMDCLGSCLWNVLAVESVGGCGSWIDLVHFPLSFLLGFVQREAGTWGVGFAWGPPKVQEPPQLALRHSRQSSLYWN